MTALSVLSEDLGLGAMEYRFVHAMLSATPLAIKGESTMVPLDALAKAIEPDLEPEERNADNLCRMLRNGVGVGLAGLLRRQRTLRVAAENTHTSFVVLDMVAIPENSNFAHFQVNHMFLQLLSQIASERQIAPF